MDPGYVTGLNKDVCVILLSLQFSSDFLEHSYIKVEYIITHHHQHPYLVLWYKLLLRVCPFLLIAP